MNAQSRHLKNQSVITYNELFQSMKGEKTMNPNNKESNGIVIVTNQSVQDVDSLWVDPMCYPSWSWTCDGQKEFISKENAMVERTGMAPGFIMVKAA